MNKLLTTVAMLMLTLTLSGTEAFKRPAFRDNWSIGVDAGVISPLKGGNFIGNFRPTIGVNVGKQITPAFGLGVEADWSINTSSWYRTLHSSTAFDHSYVGALGTIDLFNLFGPVSNRRFTIGVTAGCGWGHTYMSGKQSDRNFFASKAGFIFNFNLSRNIALALKPALLWKMGDFSTTSTLNGRRALFSLQAGLRYNFGPGFEAARLYDAAEVDALNGEINVLRSQLDACNQATANANELIAAMSSDLEEARNHRPDVIREVTVDNRLNTVLDVFFHIGSSTVTSDQMPNVERIASYLKNHPGSKVSIKGYASRDGNLESNLRLARQRAESVRNVLINKYKISADRITAEGAGIGEMFEEDSWNRVSVCTLEDNKK